MAKALLQQLMATLSMLRCLMDQKRKVALYFDAFKLNILKFLQLNSD